MTIDWILQKACSFQSPNVANLVKPLVDKSKKKWKKPLKGIIKGEF